MLQRNGKTMIIKWAVPLGLAALLLAGGCNQDEQPQQQTATARPAAAELGLTDFEEPKASEPVAGKVRQAKPGRAAEDTEQDAESEGSDEEQPEEPAPPVIDGSLDGAIAYVANRCAVCHGPERKGTSLAPPLMNLAANWNQANMLLYLSAPDVYLAGDERLRELRQDYGDVTMPAFSGEDHSATSLARWLLHD